MNLFLLWRPAAAPSPGDLQSVAEKFAALFAPLFRVPLQARVINQPPIALVNLSLPVQGWRAVDFEEGSDGWALALDYPTNSAQVLARRDLAFPPGRPLLALCRALEKDPESLLRELAPPFALVWYSRPQDAIFVQTDGLGQTQLFEHEHEGHWSLTNRITALRALGIQPAVDWREWALRLAVGWFPRQAAGFHHVRFAPPGVRWRITRERRVQTRFDSLRDWLHPPAMSRDDALELALASLRDQIRALMPLWEKPSVGLSGGWDSRVVVAALRGERVACDLRVRGLPDRPDVRIARRLAGIAALDLRVKTSSSLPPVQPERCRAAIGRALLWQAGGMVTRQHKVFLANERLLAGGRVNVLGQHGEIARGFYPAKIAATGIRATTADEGLIQLLLAQTPPAFLPRVRSDVAAMVRESLREADGCALEGDSRLDYFFLTEDTRRWASASLASLPGVTCAPLLTPGFIRATFALPPAERCAQAIHRHILTTCAPDWRDVPFTDEVGTSPRHPPATGDWKQPTGRHNYDNLAYWKTVGWPLIDAVAHECPGHGEVFDSSKGAEDWLPVADELVIASLIPEVFPA